MCSPRTWHRRSVADGRSFDVARPSPADSAQAATTPPQYLRRRQEKNSKGQAASPSQFSVCETQTFRFSFP